jgi:RNA polymerase sigma-70 factor (ECF subfamily)
VNPSKTAILGAAHDSSPPLADAERERLGRLVEEQLAFVWRNLRRLGVSPAAADDGAQQVFLVVAQKLSTLAEGAERGFIYRTVCHVAANARRAAARGRDRAGDVSVLADPSPNPEELTERREGRRILDEMLEELDDDARQVFVLFELEAMGVPEMAELLELPEGTCASRLRRAREQFNGALKRLRARQSNARGPR